jgi:hypothetical protein
MKVKRKVKQGWRARNVKIAELIKLNFIFLRRLRVLRATFLI